MFDLEYIKDIVKRNALSIVCIIFGICSLAFSIWYITANSKKCDDTQPTIIAQGTIEEKSEIDLDESETTTIKVDVKGAVVKPGVYEFDKIVTVNEAILAAGGVTTKGTTININLSRKIKDEMVIYVFTKTELEKENSKNEIVCEIPKCECETIKIDCLDSDKSTQDSSNNKNDKKVSINRGTIEELDSLDGIGEAKAKAIIEYREKNGDFSKLEDIVKVTGISETIYEKIKDRIEL